jgi:hypothetical protein
MASMTSISPQQARDYLARWRLVEKAQTEEWRMASLETRVQQLAVLMASRSLFGNDPDRERQVGEIRDRWARIRLASHG